MEHKIKVISHRGNIKGPNPQNENNPFYIWSASYDGYDVEIDLWKEKDKLYLGHDGPTYKINESFLMGKGLWIHAKNFEAVEFLRNTNYHWFWHQNDFITLTSKGIIWCYPGYECDGGVMVDKGQSTEKKIVGICTDFPRKFKISQGNF